MPAQGRWLLFLFFRPHFPTFPPFILNMLENEIIIYFFGHYAPGPAILLPGSDKQG
jgi:hypothetical protein